MKRNIILGSLVALLVATVLWAQTPGFSYGNSWKKVEQLAEKQLPESALKEVENIIRQARKEKNTVQLVKATLYKMRFTLQNDPDKAPGLIGDFEAFTEEMNDPTDKALLYSMTADLYAQHYQSNLWNINHRTEITGTIPEDIKEWTKNIYFDKISGLLDASLAHTPLLQKTNVLKYGELLEKGADSRKLQPTLFDLLASRKIEILSSINQATNIKNPLLENGYFADAARFVQLKPDSAYANSIENKIIVTYRQILSYQMKVNNIPALISADLERLNYFHSNIGNSDSLYVGALNSLKAKFSNNENVVEVLAELAAHYQGKREDRESDEENDSLSDKYNRLAYDICADGIKRFPNYKRINVLYNIQQQITQKELNISYSNETPLVSNLKVRVESKNLGKLQLTVYRVNATAMQYHDFQAKYSNERTYYPDRTLIENRLVSVKCDPDFGTTQTDVSIKPQAYGIYDFYLEEPGNKLPEKRTKGSFVVTDLGYIIRSTKAKKADVYVLNRLSGLPQPDVRVKVYSPKWNGKGYDDTYLGLFTTNSQGLATFGYDQNYYSADLYFENGKDSYFSSRSTPHYSERNSMENQDLKVSLLTDRSVYRPGQTVYFKAIAYRADKEKQTVEANTRLEVELYDANSQKVASKSLTTNEFGSVSGAFVLPEGGLNGAFSIRTTNAYQTFWVEEYKRPTFEVKLEKPAAEIRFGEKASLNGSVEAYAGYGVGSTKVKYRIVRTVHHFCWWYSEPEQEIANDTTVTDGNGNFELSFVPAKPKPTGSKYSDRAYTYTVYCDATDPKGETQHGEQYVSVGDKSLFIITEIPTEINKNNIPSIEISTQTINDQVVNSTIQYSVSRLKETEAYNEKLDESKDLQVAAEVLSGKFETANKKLPLNELKNFESGRYRIVLTATDSHGKEVKLEKTFILYASSDKRPPVKSYVWFQTPKTNCAVGENAQVQFSTSTQNSMVLYEIMQGNTVLESRWIPFSDEIKTFDIPFTEQFGAGVTVMFTFMKDEQLFTRTVQLTRRINLKKLSPTVSVFRDKLQPGEKAEWTVSIPESANGKAAELMVGMYDASLDVLYPHNWNFYPVYNEQVLNSPVWRANDFESTGSSAFFNVNLKTVNDLSFDQINWFGLELGGYYERRRFRMSGLKFTAPVIKNDEELSSQEELSSAKVFSIADVKGNDLVNAKDITQALQGKIAGLEIVTSKQQPEVKPRTNFNETAFFYPQLRTDDKGNVKFTFTAPESLTRWNVKMLAHTQDLYFGQFDTTAITQKDFMVQMNLPRFVRRSDELVLSASVINLTDQAQQATVQFEMIDPATNKVICTKTSHLSLGRGAGGEVHWELTEFAPYDLVICKVVARAGNFSDGEQKYLPVLPDKVLVTESLPLTIRGNQKRAFTFESLLKNGGKVDNKSLTVEFSSNPAWYAVQALPTLSTPESDNALSLFTAYYANSLAGFIANSNPKIVATFARWKNSAGSREALLSNLQKNTELKNMLLEETPWVMAAKDETEQKRQIALLFDLNMQKNQAETYFQKLLKLQNADGSFSWFEGMSGSRYITQEILLDMARLNKMTGKSVVGSQQSVVNSALTYLDLEISRDFAELKKYNPNYQKENCTGNMQLFYLHVRSEYPEIPLHESAKEAVKYYTAQSEKFWTDYTLYGKAMMATVAKRNGKTQVATDILKSLKENALKTDEFGMYWARNSAGYFWNERPVNVQAAIIEAFTEISGNSPDIDEMKIWLLKQKQTQRWDSPIASVNAVYALLLRGSDWLQNVGKVDMKIGNKTLESQTTEAGTGYFKESIPVAEIRPEMGNIIVSTIGGATQSRTPNSTNIGWGAMYWQYYQEQDQIEAQGSALKITKNLFRKSGASMVPVGQVQLKKGDRVVVRLVVTTDRNLEFVALKDLRASCFEPVEQRSGCQWKEGVCYYQTTKDASTQFFFSFLPKGNYVFEYEMWANNAGTFTSGIASVQCQYAPEFVSHTGGQKINIVP